MERKVKIAVIDTYVDVNSNVLQNMDIHFSSFMFDEDEVEKQSHCGHGTAVCSIISKTCTNVEITVYPVFENLEKDISINEIISVLKDIYQNNHFDLINMSFGITEADIEDIEALENICNMIDNNGTIIVAAFDNNGSMSYPAAFQSVIGVDITNKVISHLDYEYIINSPINIRGSSRLQRVLWENNQYILVTGSSFVCPYITGLIANIIESNVVSKQKIMYYLSEKAIIIRDNANISKYSCDSTFFVKKAIAFPFNKEIHSIAMFSSLLTFELIDIYDIKHTMRVHKKTSILLGRRCDKDYIIKNIDSLNWNSNFDTIIIGHVEEIARIVGHEYIKSIIDMAIKHNKQIYAFDKSIKEYIDNENNQVRFYYPRIDKERIPIQNYGKMWHINTPILAILGTRSKQGKFSVQQMFRKKLMEKGYNIGFLATEPSGGLFNAQDVFPFGYNSSILVPVEETVPILNEILHEIDIQKFDLIITGGQSGCIPYDLYNTQNILLWQAAYLYGINPDAVVICICFDDDVEYIKRTISFIESTCNTEVIAAVLFPIAYESYAVGQYRAINLSKMGNYSDVSLGLSEKLGIPVYTHSSEDINFCIELVEKFFD
ncbi:MAG: S8 family serine peptidase [Eubacteriales bacterium]